MFIDDKHLDEYRLHVLYQTAPNLLNNESLDEMFNVILVRQKVKVKSRQCFLLFTNVRLMLLQFEDRDKQLLDFTHYYLGDLNKQDPYKKLQLQREREQRNDPVYVNLQFATTTGACEYAIGLRPEDFKLFAKQFDKHNLKNLEEDFKLVEEELQGSILGKNPDDLRNYSKLIVNKEHQSLMTDEQYWSTNQEFVNAQGGIFAQGQQQGAIMDRQIVEQLTKCMPKQQKQPFAMERLYESPTTMVPENLYKVDLENDLVMNFEDPEESFRRFHRHHPSKQVQPKQSKTKKDDRNIQIEAYDRKKQMQDLQSQCMKEYLKAAIDVEQTIHNLNKKTQETIKEEHPSSYELYDGKQDFKHKLEQNDGAETFSAQTINFESGQHKKNIVKPNVPKFHQWDSERNQVLSSINEQEIYEQFKRNLSVQKIGIDHGIVIDDSTRTAQVSYKRIQRLEQKEKAFLQLVRVMYTDVRRLLQILYNPPANFDRVRANIELELNNERQKIREYIEKEGQRLRAAQNMQRAEAQETADFEMKKQILEDLQRMIEKGLNQLK